MKRERYVLRPATKKELSLFGQKSGWVMTDGDKFVDLLVDVFDKAVIPRPLNRIEAIAEAAATAREIWTNYRIPIQLIVKTRRGTISFERTYPRKSDPKGVTGDG